MTPSCGAAPCLAAGAMRTFALVAAAALLLVGGAAAQCTTIVDCDDCTTDPTMCRTCAAGFTPVDIMSLWCVTCLWRLEGEGRWRWGGYGGGACKHGRAHGSGGPASCWQSRVCAARRCQECPLFSNTRMQRGQRCVPGARLPLRGRLYWTGLR